MPLQRSQSSRNLNLNCMVNQPKKRPIDSKENSNFSSLESFGREALFDPKNSQSFTSVRLLKRARRTHNENEEKFKKCDGCQKEKLVLGFFMYLDRCFCSEQCRLEAITVDEIQCLRVS
mmetsp:Transcript_6419/g.8830  ORF Transcript_6419/g.8830 Transcript_6419/m.8830 type:complete len:119 (+) Transcript_6419:173-529(+)